MNNQHRESQFDRDKALSQNKSVDVNVVTAHEELELELKQLGVEIKPSFLLEPPLGWDRTRILNQNRLTSHRERRNAMSAYRGSGLASGSPDTE